MKRLLTFKIQEDLNNKSIQAVLAQFGFSSAIIKSLKEHPDGVLLNNVFAKTVDRVLTGDTLSVTISEPVSHIASVEMPLDILYEDGDIIAVNKPRNMPTHPSHEHTTDTLANALMYYFKSDFTFHPITRLDKDTSGVVLIAKNALSAHILTQSIKLKQIQKQYLAVTCGIPNKLSGVISAPIEKAEGILRKVSSTGKEAVTKYNVIETAGNFALIELSPITGRTHQLRVHMAHINTPIHGDWLYNLNPSDGVLKLHCHSIAFNHPVTKELLTITAPIPDDMNIIY